MSPAEDAPDLELAGTTGPDGEAPGPGQRSGESTHADGDTGTDAVSPGDESAADGDGDAGDPALEAPAPTPEAAIAGRLSAVWRVLRRQGGTASYAVAFEEAGQAPQEEEPAECARRLWTWMHLLSLRVPAAQGDELRIWFAREANKAVGDTDEKPADDEAGDAGGAALVPAGGLSPDEYLVPPLGIIGFDGSDAGARPGDTKGDTSDALARMALLARQVDWLAAHDPAVRTGFLNINRDPELRQLNDRSRENYRLAFSTRLPAVRSPTADSLVRLDEAIRGIVPVPMPSADSWWRQRLDETGRTLKDKLGEQVFVPTVKASYQLLRDSGTVGDDANNVRIDASDTDSAKKGDVAWVLRARIKRASGEGPDDRARVVYVPLG
jgi:hypothetical protein